MVILAHFLKAGLSNSSSTLSLIIEDNRFTGLAKLFLMTSMNSLNKPRVLALCDQAFSEVLKNQEGLQVILSESFSLEVFSDERSLFLDNLEFFVWKFGQWPVFQAIQARNSKGLGTVAVCNKSYIDLKVLDTFFSLAEVVISILSFDESRGTAKCVHLRGYVKNTEEVVGFLIEGDLVKECKVNEPKSNKGPNSTFRLEMTEEEKTMKDLTPLPYEKNHPVYNFDPNDSPDEEGDEDDYF
jgi:hypothetical protein